MGLFGSKKIEIAPLLDNEFRFKKTFFKYIINDNTLVVQLFLRNGKLVSEENFSLRQIENIENKSIGGDRYRIEIKMINESKTPPIRRIDYSRSDEGEKATKLISMLSERLR